MGGNSGALLSGILQGYAQGSREQEQLTVENDYKKAMISKVKNDLDIEQMKLGAMRRLQADPTDIAAQQMLGIKVDPLDQLIMNKIRTGGTGNTAPTANTELPAVPGFSQFFGGTEQPAPVETPSMGGIALSGARDELDQLFGPDWMGKAIRHKYLGETNANPNDTVREVQTYDRQGNPVSVPRVRGGGLLWNQAVPSHVKEEWGPSPYPGVDYAFRGSNVVIDPMTNQPKFRQYPVKGERVTVTGPGGEQTSTMVSPFMGTGWGPLPGPAPTGKLNLTFDTTQPGWQDEAKRAIDQAGTAPKPTLGPKGVGIQTTPGVLDRLPDEQKGERLLYKDAQGNAAPPGVTIRQLVANGFVRLPDKQFGTEDASKLNSGIQSLGDIDLTKNWLMPNGILDRRKIIALRAWFTAPESMGGSEAAKYGKMMESAVEAQLRLASGAAVPPEEVTRYARDFVGQYMNKDDAVATGFDLLYNRLNGTINLVDPSGYYRNLAKKGGKERSPSLNLGNKTTGTTSSGGKWTIKPGR